MRICVRHARDLGTKLIFSNGGAQTIFEELVPGCGEVRGIHRALIIVVAVLALDGEGPCLAWLQYARGDSNLLNDLGVVGAAPINHR